MRMKQLPLYSRGNPLKNLIKKRLEENDTTILYNQDFRIDRAFGTFDDRIPMNGFESIDEGKLSYLYNAVIRKWYFEELGLDTDEEFEFRFSSVFWKYYPYYSKYVDMIKAYEKDTETLDINGVNGRTMSESGTSSNTDSMTIRKTGDITQEKGVTTTSTQNTQNTGNKLTRTTPNEDMTVVGSAENTVVDSGSNVDTYNTTDTHTGNQNGTNSKTVNDSLTVETSNERSKLTTSNLLEYGELLNIIERFVYKFENLFMEVY